MTNHDTPYLDCSSVRADNVAQARSNYSNPTTLAAVSSSAMAQWCTDTLASALAIQTTMTSTVQSLLIDQRLGDQRTTGKIAVRNSITAALRLLMANINPELLDPAFNVPAGTLAHAGLHACTLAQARMHMHACTCMLAHARHCSFTHID